MSTPAPILQYTLSDATMKGLLPAGYTPLAYIESTGTLYIDTGWKFNNETDSLSVTFQHTTSDNTMILGDISSGNRYFWLYYYSSTNRLDIYTSDNNGAQRSIPGPTRDLNKHEVLYKNKVFYVDGVNYGNLSSYTFIACNVNLAIGRYSGGLISKCKYYDFKIWNGINLVADFRPAKRDSDGVIGMYDLVSRTFKTNSGSGSFIAGPELAVGKGGGKSLPEEYLLVEYLEGNGDLSINTGVSYDSTNNNYVVKCRFQMTSYKSTYQGVYMAYKDENSSTFRLLRCANDAIFLIGYNNKAGGGNLSVGVRSIYDIFEVTHNYDGITVNNLSNLTTLSGTSNHSTPGTSTTGDVNFTIICSCPCKMWYFRLYNGTTIVRNMIPCYRKSDMKPGMYDTVNGVFYTNAGTGEFILGPTVSSYYSCEVNAVGKNMWPETPGAYGNRGTLAKTSYGCYTIAGNSNGNYTRFDLLGFNYKPGPWTISFDAYATTNTSVLLDICDKGAKTITITPTKQRFYVTATATDYYSPDRYYNGFFDIEGTITGTVYISNLCLMLGDRGTTYSPYKTDGLYTNLSGIYDSSKGWVAHCTGQGSHIQLPALGSLITNGTVAVWCKLNTPSSRHLFIGNNALNKWIGAWETSDRNLYHGSSGSITNYIDGVAKSTVPNDSNWHFYCFTGVNLSQWGSENLFLNHYGTSNYNVNCEYQNLMIFDTALTAAQVKELYDK